MGKSFDRFWKSRENQSEPSATLSGSVSATGDDTDGLARLARAKVSPEKTDDGTPGVAQVTFDNLGVTSVCTILDRALTSERVNDLSLQIRTYLMNNPGVKNLVLDLQNVDYLDSCCLNMLIVLMKGIRENGGQIAIASAQRSIAVLFKLTRLDSLFPIQRDVLSAIEYVDRARAA